jgi:hypothetical protein
MCSQLSDRFPPCKQNVISSDNFKIIQRTKFVIFLSLIADKVIR